MKIRVDNLATNGGIINFSDSCHLAMFRTKSDDVWKYLQIRNKTNANLPCLKQIQIPPECEWKSKEPKKRIHSEFNTTKVRLCFQVR